MGVRGKDGVQLRQQFINGEATYSLGLEVAAHIYDHWIRD